MSIGLERDVTFIGLGDIDPSWKEAACDRVAAVCAHAHEPALFAEVKLEHAPDPARARPYIAEATITFSGATIRAHVAAASTADATALLDARLRRRVDRFRTKRADRRHGSAQPDTTGRHGELPSQRPERFERPAFERGLVRHKTFAVGAMTPDEAADTMDLLGHDFLLFTNLTTGGDAVIAYAESGLELRDASGSDDAIGADTVTPIALVNTAVRHCSQQRALQELDLGLEPFVFFVDPARGRGQVAYIRYDGHYGLISPA